MDSTFLQLTMKFVFGECVLLFPINLNYTPED